MTWGVLPALCEVQHPFFTSHPSHPLGGLPASEVPHGSWLVVPRTRASHDTSASRRPVHRTYDRTAEPQ